MFFHFVRNLRPLDQKVFGAELQMQRRIAEEVFKYSCPNLIHAHWQINIDILYSMMEASNACLRRVLMSHCECPEACYLLIAMTITSVTS